VEEHNHAEIADEGCETQQRQGPVVAGPSAAARHLEDEGGDLMATWFEPVLTEQEEQAVAQFMARIASTPLGDTPSLAGADVLWWKAQLLRRWDAERKVTAPLDVMEPVEIVTAMATAAILFLWALPSLLRVFTIG